METNSNNFAQSWLHLRDRLENTRNLSKPTLWTYTPNLDVPKDEAETQWLDFCLKRRTETDRLINAWLERNEIPNAEDTEYRFLFCIRFAQAAHFCALHAFLQHGTWTSPFPIPALDEKLIMKYLLIDWWWGIGVFLGFDDGWLAHTKIE